MLQIKYTGLMTLTLCLWNTSKAEKTSNGKKKKKKAQTQAAVKMHKSYSMFESEVSLERCRVQFSPSLENFPKMYNCPLAHVEH